MCGCIYMIGILVVEFINLFLFGVIESVIGQFLENGYKVFVGVGYFVDQIEVFMIEVMIDN